MINNLRFWFNINQNEHIKLLKLIQNMNALYSCKILLVIITLLTIGLKSVFAVCCDGIACLWMLRIFSILMIFFYLFYSKFYISNSLSCKTDSLCRLFITCGIVSFLLQLFSFYKFHKLKCVGHFSSYEKLHIGVAKFGAVSKNIHHNDSDDIFSLSVILVLIS